MEVVTLCGVQEIRMPLPKKRVAAQERPGVPSVLAVPRSGHEEDLQSQDVGSCTGRAASLLGALLQSSPPRASHRAQNRVPRAEIQGDPHVAEGGSWQLLLGLALGLLLLGLSSGSRGRSSGRIFRKTGKGSDPSSFGGWLTGRLRELSVVYGVTSPTCRNRAAELAGDAWEGLWSATSI